MKVVCAGALVLASSGLHATIAPFDTASRTAVADAYHNTYLPLKSTPSGWNGNVASCNAGTTTTAHQQATIDAANFYRVMVGLPQVNLVTDNAAVNRARQAALISARNEVLDHEPLPSSLCYSAAGYEGAKTSNLSLGAGFGAQVSAAGPGAIDGYIDDSFALDSLGHRRWVLYQLQTGFATGDIVNPSGYSTNALRVMPAPSEAMSLFWSASYGSLPASPAWAAWPSPNFVPGQMLPSASWSLSYPGADFSGATVSVTTANGISIPTTVSALPSGYGDDTLSFQPAIPAFSPGAADTSYKVVVSGVGNASNTSYCYTVTVFDPDMPGLVTTAPDLCVSGAVNQSIAFTTTAPASPVVGGTYAVGASATSGLPVAFSIDSASASVCSISGSTVTFNAVGACIVNADQAGNAGYNPATQAQQSMTVGQGNQTITFPAQTSSQPFILNGTFALNPVASASSGLAVTYFSDTPAICSITGTTVTMLAEGACRIGANQSGNANWTTAATQFQTIVIGTTLSSQTITFKTAPPAAPTVGGTYTVNAEASSGLPVTYTINSASASVCSITGSTVTFNAAGVCVINANQAGNGSFAPAGQQQQSITVSKKSQTISFGPQTLASRAFAFNGTFAIAPVAAASSGLGVAYTSLTPAICSVSGTTVTMLAAGTCTIAANQSGDNAWAAAPQVSRSIAISPASQSITFTSTPPSNPMIGDSYQLSALGGGSGEPVVFSLDPGSAAGACTLAGQVVTFTGNGACIIVANQAGNANFGAAPPVKQPIFIGAGAPSPNTVAVPTLELWALWLLAAMTGLTGLAVFRRK
jgi:hypothetical protein